MLKYVWAKLKENWKKLNKIKMEDDWISRRSLAIATFLIIFISGLTNNHKKLWDIDNIIQSLESTMLIVVVIISFISGYYSSEYLYHKKRRALSYIPIGNLKEETRRMRWKTILIAFIILVVLPFYPMLLFMENSKQFYIIPLVTIFCFFGYVMGLNAYFRR